MPVSVANAIAAFLSHGVLHTAMCFFIIMLAYKIISFERKNRRALNTKTVKLSFMIVGYIWRKPLLTYAVNVHLTFVTMVNLVNAERPKNRILRLEPTETIESTPLVKANVEYKL